MRRLILITTLFLLLLPATIRGRGTQVYPEERCARVAVMLGISPWKSSTGGWTIVLDFEDNIQPRKLRMILSKRLYDQTMVGELWIAQYRIDGTMINCFPVKNGNER